MKKQTREEKIVTFIVSSKTNTSPPNFIDIRSITSFIRSFFLI